MKYKTRMQGVKIEFKKKRKRSMFIDTTGLLKKEGKQNDLGCNDGSKDDPIYDSCSEKQKSTI